MFTKTLVTTALILILLMGDRLCKASAQDSNSTKATSEATTVNAYRLDFSVNEIDDGKKSNTRQYSMNVNADDANEVKIGTKVPVDTKQGEFQYIDVGTNIWCRIGERANGIPLSVRAEISNFATPTTDSRHDPCCVNSRSKRVPWHNWESRWSSAAWMIPTRSALFSSKLP